MVHLHLACNNPDNGNHTGQVDSIQFFGGDDLDPMLMLNGQDLVCRLLNSMTDSTVFLRLGHLSSVVVHRYANWVGNWCWDAALVSAADAAKVANYLRSRGWQNEGGWVDMGEKWDAADVPFTEQDFKED